MFEGCSLFGALSLNYYATGPFSVLLFTDLPGEELALRETLVFNGSTAGPRVKERALRGTTKGRIYRVQFAPAAGTILHVYGAALWTRKLGRGTASPWVWTPLQVPHTGAEYAKFPLAIPRTADEYSKFRIAIPRTADEYSKFALAIPRTADEYHPFPLSIPASSDDPRWVDFAMDE